MPDDITPVVSFDPRPTPADACAWLEHFLETHPRGSLAEADAFGAAQMGDAYRLLFLATLDLLAEPHRRVRAAQAAAGL